MHRVDLVVGDLNASLDHPTLRDLVDAGWRDSVELANDGFAPTWPVDSSFPVLGLLPPTVQIDHVMVSVGMAFRPPSIFVGARILRLDPDTCPRRGGFGARALPHSRHERTPRVPVQTSWRMHQAQHCACSE